MHLAPHEVDKLTLLAAGLLAQRRLARGLRLNHPEAVALVSVVLLELIRDGRHGVPELMALGGTILGRRQVMPGVADMVGEIHVEGTFPDGTKLVAVRDPIAAETGDLALALHGSFLPVPDEALFADASPDAPATAGRVVTASGTIALNAGRDAIDLVVTNTDNRPVQVGSHFHFLEANPRLRFDRAAAYGKRLDIPAGSAVRFEPDETKTVSLVDIAGNRVIRGGNNLADGKVDEAGRERALARIAAHRNLAGREGAAP